MNRIDLIKQACQAVKAKKANENYSQEQDYLSEKELKNILDRETKPVKLRQERYNELNFN